MSIVMLSLDKKILDPSSAVAKRMIEYGSSEELFIAIPDKEKRSVTLSPRVQVETSGGGNKLIQLWNLYGVAERYLLKQQASLITAQDPFFLGFLALQLRWQFKTKVEMQVHGDFYSNNYYRFGFPKRHVLWHMGKLVLPRADKIRVVGERIKQSLLKLGIPPERITVRPIQTNASAIQSYQAKFNIHEQFPQWKKIFLVLGRLDPVKNIAWLIDVFSDAQKERPGIGLLIIGDGPERERLLQQIRKSGMENSIRMLPWTNDPWSYIKTADALLFSSLSEGYGLVAMEAAAAGTPVIINDVGVANYELKRGPKVTIVPVNDKKDFLSAMARYSVEMI